MNVSKCENRGTITGKISSGGLVGRFNNSIKSIKSSTFENSNNYGTITAENRADGGAVFRFVLKKEESARGE